MLTLKKNTIVLFAVFLGLYACKTEDKWETTAYDFKIAAGYPKPSQPADNIATEEGVALGRRLFYDVKLSENLGQSCASCHKQEFAFSDPNKFSTGTFGQTGKRNSMALINLAFNPFQRFFWDGRSKTLEDQVLHPVQDPLEMATNWTKVVSRLQADPIYPGMFKKAFGTDKIDSVLAAKALAQFVRTLVSFDSKFDKWIKGQATLDSVEQAGLNLIQDLNGGDCFHCHNAEDKLFTSSKMSNNGLDFEAQWTDLGFYKVTGLETDKAKFKTPTLRNVALTGPYMHDGRFSTLPQVIIQHYNTGGKLSPTIDVFMEYVNTPNGLDLSPNEVNAILKFLNTLTDSTFITNPKFSSPF